MAAKKKAAGAKPAWKKAAGTKKASAGQAAARETVRIRGGGTSEHVPGFAAVGVGADWRRFGSFSVGCRKLRKWCLC